MSGISGISGEQTPISMLRDESVNGIETVEQPSLPLMQPEQAPQAKDSEEKTAMQTTIQDSAYTGKGGLVDAMA